MEKQLEEALPKMAEAATDPELAKGFEMHLKETEGQSKRLEQIFEILDAEPEMHELEAIRGLIADGDAISTAYTRGALRDVMLAGAGRDVEHYEMSSYMNAIEEAKELDLTKVVTLLEETLEEEKMSEEKLTTALKNNLELAKTESAMEE